MQVFQSTVLLLSCSLLSTTAEILDTFEISEVSLSIARAANNVDKAIMSFQQELGHEQPICLDPVLNYIKCLTIPDDIDDTEFLVHPLAPPGTILSELKGTPDYDMAYKMVEAFREAIQYDSCGDANKFGLAVYPWLAADQQSTITATSLVKDFSAPTSQSQSETYMCGTGPLSEEYVLKKSSAKKEMKFAFEALRGFNNLDFASKQVKNGGDDVQPPCEDNLDNFIQCMTFPEDIDETEVVVHPVFPIGMKLGDLKGTPDYEFGKNMFEAFRSAVSTSECENAGSIGVAQYPWVKADDRFTRVTATSLVMDFMGPANYNDRRLSNGNANGLRREQETTRYLCGTGPLAEDLEYDQEKENNYLVTSSAVVFKGFFNLENALDNLNRDSDDLQPACMDPINNYVKCLTIPDDIDDTTFLVHPVVPVGTQLRVLKGTPDYALGKNMIEALRDALENDECSDVGHVRIAKYPWLSSLDRSTELTAYSVVMEFMAATGWQTPLDGVKLSSAFNERYMCSTGPILEEFPSGDGPKPILVNGKPEEEEEIEDEEVEEEVLPVEDITVEETEKEESQPVITSTATKELAKPQIGVEKSFMEDTSEKDETGSSLEVQEPEPEQESKIETQESNMEEENSADAGDVIKTGIDILASNSETSPTSDGARIGNLISIAIAAFSVSAGMMLL